jgi:hypothetical protein
MAPIASRSTSFVSASDDSDSSDESRSVPLLPHVMSGLSDAETFDSTPTGSECDFGSAKSRFAAIGIASEDTRPECSEQAAEAVGPQVWVQVPITLPVGFTEEAVRDSLMATVENISQSSLVAGEVVIDMRLRLCMPAPPPNVPASLLLADVLQTPPTKPATVALPTVSPATAVCCHWKNKGFCTYMDTCKFLHPEHKRGVGSSKVAVPSRTRGGARRGGRAPVTRE